MRTVSDAERIVQVLGFAVLLCLPVGLFADTSAPLVGSGPAEIPPPLFRDVSVHDPSVIKDGETYWIIGSHLASAWSTDLLQWGDQGQPLKLEFSDTGRLGCAVRFGQEERT